MEKSIKEILAEAEALVTPKELIDEILDCLSSLYSEDGGKRLPNELSKYAGVISVAYRQSRLLQTKLNI